MRTLLILSLVAAPPLVAQARPPIIDMHLHALPADDNGPPPLGLCVPVKDFPPHDARRPWPETWLAWQKQPPCPRPVWSPATDRELMQQTIAVMERRNIIGVLSGRPALVQQWVAAAPARFIPGFQFRFGREQLSADSLGRLFRSGAFAVFAEVTNQYVGVSPSDPRFEPYLAVAESLDIPVGIHIGTGPPGAPHLGMAQYRSALHSALTLEEALMRHPRLRVFVMHAGWPMLDDMLAVMWAHPHVYVELGGLGFGLPRAEFHRYLRRIVEAGFGKRVMFGSDQMVWPGVIEVAIAGIESATFLTPDQKRDILYNNAARFLRLSDAEVARHHGRRAP